MKHAGKRRMMARCSSTGSDEQIDNILKDYANFLSCAPIQLFNLKPGEDGVVNAKLKDLANYSQVYIVAVDPDSATQMSVSVSQILAQASEPVKTEIPMRDLAQNKAISDGETGLIESRVCQTLTSGVSVHIEDFSSSKLQIIDDMTKVSKIIEFTQQMHYVSPGYNGKIKSLIEDVLMPWPKWDSEKQIQQYKKNACHEMNLFLSKHDRSFFDKYALPLISGKLEKTFVDWYLLSEMSTIHLRQICNVIDNDYMLQQLNIFELCLLIETCLKHGSAEQQTAAKALATSQIMVMNVRNAEIMSQQGAVDLYTKIFEQILNSSDLDGGAANLIELVEEARMEHY